jgi:hypothetical protein
MRLFHWSKKYKIRKIVQGCLPKAENTKSLKILFGPSFSIWKPSFLNEKLFAEILKRKGHTVIPVICDQVQKIECNVFAGDWNKKASFKKSCKFCYRSQMLQWKDYDEKIFLSEFIKKDEAATIQRDSMEQLQDIDYEFDGVQYGKLAANIVSNSYLLSDVTLLKDYKLLTSQQIANLKILNKCYKSMLEFHRPDRVFSNDSFYGMWRLLQDRSVERGIPFYNFWPVTKERFAFSRDSPCMDPDFSFFWKSFKDVNLTDDEKIRVDQWLRGGRKLLLDTEIHEDCVTKDFLKFDKNKPTVLLPANLIWDLAGLDRQVIFRDMADWIVKTIEWFKVNPGYQLIIKPHPMEISRHYVPKTRETVESIIQKNISKLPENIILLKPDTDIRVTDIKKYTHLKGCVVHTTTVGFEFPAQLIPSISTARSPYRGLGISHDPTTTEEYFSLLSKLLHDELADDLDIRKELAYKYIKLYFFHYFVKLNTFVGEPEDLFEHPELQEDLKNQNSTLNLIIDNMILAEDKIGFTSVMDET